MQSVWFIYKAAHVFQGYVITNLHESDSIYSLFINHYMSGTRADARTGKTIYIASKLYVHLWLCMMSHT